jgi:hypothetical protein
VLLSTLVLYLTLEFCVVQQRVLQDISNLVWSVATTRHLAPRLMELSSQAALTLLPGFSPQQLANTAWAFASQGVLPPPLLEGICSQALGKLEHSIGHAPSIGRA